MSGADKTSIPLLDEVARLNDAEKYRLWEHLWEEISRHPEAVPVPEEHKKIIRERLAEHRRNPDDTRSMDQVMKELLSSE